MSITLDAEQIIDGGIVENERVEYKRGWNPEPILHTLCAFANDIENQGGGYIIVGIEEKDGMPGEVVGVAKEEVDGLNSRLLDLCNEIDPKYRAETEYCGYRGKGLFVIKAPGGPDRPYRCRVSLSEKKTERAHYIRKMGRTIRTTPSDEKELHRISENVPFDDRPNRHAKLTDLSMGLIYEYLRGSRSRMLEPAQRMTLDELVDNMHLVSGPQEDRRPLNVGLMFFNEHPEDFFRHARIEIVYKPDPTGRNMEEYTITGPLDRQFRDAVRTISNSFIKEYVTKVSDRPDAVRAFNYPREAVEEAISNAIYHKAYDMPEPITISIYPDRMEITSVPGPDPSITDEDIRAGRLVSRHYRNRRIGEFLKELKLAEGRNTGIPIMMESMALNGSDRPVFKTDAQRSYMTVILPVNRNFLSDAAASPARESTRGSARYSKEEAIAKVLSLLSDNGEMSVREISDGMGYRSPPSSLRAVLDMLVSSGSIEYTNPEAVNHPRQRFRLRNL